jgi:hypothetical protein
MKDSSFIGTDAPVGSALPAIQYWDQNVVLNTVKTQTGIYVIPKADDRGKSGADGVDKRILLNDTLGEVCAGSLRCKQNDVGFYTLENELNE